MGQRHTSSRHEEGTTSTQESKPLPGHSRRDSGFAEHVSFNEHSPQQTMVDTSHTCSISGRRSPRPRSTRPHRTTTSSPRQSTRSSRTTSPAPSPKATSPTPTHNCQIPLGTHCTRNTSYTSLRHSSTTIARPRLHTRTRSSMSSGASSIVYARPYTSDDPFEMHRACTALFTPHSNANQTTSTQTLQNPSTDKPPPSQKPISFLHPSTRAKQYRAIDASTRGIRGLWRRWAPRGWQRGRRVGFYEQGNESGGSVRRYRIDVGEAEEERRFERKR